MKKKNMRFVRRRKWVRAHRLIGLTSDSDALSPFSPFSDNNKGRNGSMEKIQIEKTRNIENPMIIESVEKKTKMTEMMNMEKEKKSNIKNDKSDNKDVKNDQKNVVNIIDHEMADIDEEEDDEEDDEDDDEDDEEEEQTSDSNNNNNNNNSSDNNSKISKNNLENLNNLKKSKSPMSLGKGDIGQYRYREYKRGKDLILGLCKERSSCMSSSIIVPWMQVSSIELITQSVISISLYVHRYFGEDENGKQIFRPADIEIFITNCSSLKLKSLLEERMKFSHIRAEMKLILSSGNVTGVPTMNDSLSLSTYVQQPSRTGSVTVSPSTKRISIEKIIEGKRKKKMLDNKNKNNNKDDDEFDSEDEEDEEDEDDEEKEAEKDVKKESDIKKDKNGNTLSIQNKKSKTIDDSGDDNDAEEEEDDDDDDDDISRAAAATSFLDTEALDLEKRALQLEKLYKLDKQNDSILKEREVIVRRACRLRSYIGTLYGAKLKGVHNINDSEIQHIMINDFDKTLKIDMGDNVATANNKMEFLLDKVECRLRDLALCGWSKTELSLIRSLEIIVNGYFIQLVDLLAQFFKGQIIMKNIQGLQSKMQLITTYMHHDDRLSLMLESAVRPYNFIITPKPLLSLLLNLDTLLAWYSAVLHQEMKACVDSVVNIWKDVTKDASGLASKYRFPLPWIPMRKNGEEGQFQSLLPEDSTAYLLQYISLTRLHEKNIAKSFRKHVHKLDANVHLSFASAYKYLADIYSDSLQVKDWTKTDPRSLKPIESEGGTHVIMKNNNATNNSNSISNDDYMLDDNEREQLDTQIEWLCSVANDCRRITEEAMISKCKISYSYDDNNDSDDDINNNDNRSFNKSGSGSSDKGDKKGLNSETLQIARVSDKAYDIFNRVNLKAIDFISCIIFKTLLGIVDDCKILEKDLFKRWKSSIKQNCSGNNDINNKDNISSSITTTSKLIDFDFLLELLNEKLEYLEPYCHYRLLSLCIDKIVLIYLHLLKDAKSNNRIIESDGTEIIQLNIDIESISNCFQLACNRDIKLINYADAILIHLRPLKQAVSLISLSRNSKEFEKTLESLYKVCE